jgi:hypothetical protein
MTAAAEAYCYLLFDILHKLLADPMRYFFVPITAIVLVIFAVLYPVLQHRRSVLLRILQPTAYTSGRLSRMEPRC